MGDVKAGPTKSMRVRTLVCLVLAREKNDTKGMGGYI